MSQAEYCGLSDIERRLLHHCHAINRNTEMMMDADEDERKRNYFPTIETVNKMNENEKKIKMDESNNDKAENDDIDCNQSETSSEGSEMNNSMSISPPNIPSELIQQHQKNDEQNQQNVISACLPSVSLGVSTHIGGKSENQDVSFSIGLKTGCDSSIGVFDGHGKYGQRIARKVHDFFIKKIASLMSSKDKAKINLQSLDGDQSNIDEMIRKYFAEIETIICDNKKMSLKSGCTATISIQKDGKLYIGSTGDSRAVMGSSIWNHSEHKYLSYSTRLTRDHRFDIESEFDMVIKAGGEIRPRSGKDDGTLRVWVSEQKSWELGLESPAPGLMVSRSIGDYLAKVAGCSAIPDVTSFEISEENRFLIIASDGLWDVLGDEEAVDFVNGFYDPNVSGWAKTASDKLIAKALDKSKSIRFSPDNITVAIMDLRKSSNDVQI